MIKKWPRPTAEEMKASGYKGMLWLWPMAVAAGVVPAGTSPEDIFSIFQLSSHKPGSPKAEALMGLWHAAARYTYLTRRMQGPNYEWNAEATSAWGPWDAITERSRHNLDQCEFSDVWKLHADVLYAAETMLRVALANAEKGRRDTASANAAKRGAAETTELLVKSAARRIKLSGNTRHPTGAKSKVAIQIAEELDVPVKDVQDKLSALFPGDAAWNSRHE